jgi:hypothetical protein
MARSNSRQWRRSLDPAAAAFGRPKRPKQLVVELILVRLRRHLKGHDRRSGDPRAVIEDRRMIAHELGEDLGLADPSVAKAYTACDLAADRRGRSSSRRSARSAIPKLTQRSERIHSMHSSSGRLARAW